MARPRYLPTNQLDGERLFRQYYQVWGKAATFSKLLNWAAQEFGVNIETGRKKWMMACYMASWRWATKDENLEEAKKIYSEYLLQYGEFLTDEDWKWLVSRRIKTCHTEQGEKTYQRWLDKHPEFPDVRKK